MKRLFYILLLLSIPLPLHSSQTFVREQLLMGNVPVSISIRTSTHNKERAFTAMDHAFDEARRIEREVSEWRPESQATQLNQNAGGKWIPIGTDLMTILIKANEISELTDGAFDIAFASKNRSASFRNVDLIPEFHLAQLNKKRMKIGVSGIAKGYIVDRMSDVLKKEGFREYLINAGDMFAHGHWEIGIKNPDNPSGPPLCTLTLNNQAISTSGLYERGPHIINPKTKKTASLFKSVSVIAKQSILADALATGLFVNGLQNLTRIDDKFGHLTVVTVDFKGNLNTY